MRSCCFPSILLLTWLLPGVALADIKPSLLPEHSPGAARAGFGVELGFFFEDEESASTLLLTPLLSARVLAADNLELELDWPLAFASVSVDSGPLGVDDSSSAFHTGNPLLAAYYVGYFSTGYGRVGGGVTIPLADTDGVDDPADSVALVRPSFMRGFWDLWLNAPDAVSLVLPFQVESVSDGLVLGTDNALAVVVPTEDGPDEELLIQLSFMVGGRSGVTTAGARMQVFWAATGEGDDAQLAFVPFVQADFERGGFVYGRLLINLDEPLGVFGDGLDEWGLFLGGGSQF